MNLIDLKNQVNNKLSNFYFIRDSLVKNYFKDIIKIYEYLEILKEYKPSLNEKVLSSSNNRIVFNSFHSDLAHAKHEALAILDYLEGKLRKDFSMSVVSGIQSGVILMFIGKSNLHNPLVSIKFLKKKKRVELKGEFNLNKVIQNMLDSCSNKNIFKPYLISLFPIQLNDKQVIKYGNQIVKKINNRLIHDISETNHSDKLKLSSKLNIPYSISYGTKDLEASTLNVIDNTTGEFNRVKLDKLDFILSKDRKFKEIRNYGNTIYSCDSKKCKIAFNKFSGIMLKPFNQITLDKKCNICNQKASVKYINIRVGESI
jgi:histidyl-tRNA synthetase